MFMNRVKGEKNKQIYGKSTDDYGSTARFFYCAKSSKSERGENNNHPTVKPIKLMEYLVKLVTIEGAAVLDPFCGSGSTLIACSNLGRNWIGIDNETAYVDIANKRLANTYRQLELIK